MSKAGLFSKTKKIQHKSELKISEQTENLHLYILKESGDLDSEL